MLEGALAGGVILLLTVPMLLGVLDQRRRTRDTQKVSQVRQAQAALETFRTRNGSYPSAAQDLSGNDASLASAFAYEAQPQGCAADQAETCRSYVLRFTLEGQIGTLRGGTCTAGPDGLSCSP